MDEVNYDFNKYPWFSPHLVIRAFRQLLKVRGQAVEKGQEFKLAREMFEAAIALLGSYELHSENKYFMQGNLQSASPDILAAKLTKQENKPVYLEVTQMELVKMEEHAGTNDLLEFLKNTKFSKKKSYDEKTLIVCVVNKKIQVDRVKIAGGLKEMNPSSTVYVLGHRKKDKKWVIFSPYPMPTKPVFYKPSETMKKYSLPEVVTLHKGLKDKIEYTEKERKKTTIYDIFNLKK